MAAVKTNKPSKSPSKQLKAGKKKPLSKWIIVGGVATVAIVGALLVRFSGASSYTLLKSVASSQISSLGTGAQRKIISGTQYIISPGKRDVWYQTHTTNSEMSNTAKLCFHWASVNGKAISTAQGFTAAMWWTASGKTVGLPTRDKSNKYKLTGTSGYACTSQTLSSMGKAAGGSVNLHLSNATNIGVNTIYGTR